MSDSTNSSSPDILRQVYEETLAAFVTRVQQDHTILAAILYGSLACDAIWEKSDIDLLLVSREDKIAHRYYSLVENGISLQVFMRTRSTFKAMIEHALQGSFNHSVIVNSTLLFSKDETIQEYYQSEGRVGRKDQEYQLLKVAIGILPTLTKAEKWLVVKRDPIYSNLWLMPLVNQLATLEVLLHNDVARREAIWQALVYRPAFFTQIYVDLSQQPKDEATMHRAIQLIYGYLDEKLRLLFKPILSYLAETDGARSTTELNAHLGPKIQVEEHDLERLAFAYEWLVYKGVLRRVSTPIRLTKKSRITVDEAAYYYDGEDKDEADDHY